MMEMFLFYYRKENSEEPNLYYYEQGERFHSFERV